MAKNILELPKLIIRPDGSVLWKHVRLSYPHLFEMWAKNAKDKPRYSARGLADKDTHAAEIKAFRKYLDQLQEEEFKGKLKKADLFFRDGADDNKPESENAWVIAASESKKQNAPALRDKRNQEVEEDDGTFYAGCYVNMLVSPWFQKNEHGKKINANLLAVQFVRDGEAFSTVQRPDLDEVFDDQGDDDDDGDGLDD